MTAVHKFLSSEITLPATANTVGGQKLVRLLNSGTDSHVITQKDSGGNTVSTFTIRAGDIVVAEKATSDSFQVDTGTDVLAVPVAYRN